MRALIDGDIVAYSSGFAAQKKVYEVGGFFWTTKKSAKSYCDTHSLPYSEIDETVEVEDVSHALHNAKSIIDRCIRETGADKYDIYLTGSSNFRDNLVTYYKANRSREKPEHYGAIIDYLLHKHGATVIEEQEADDEMGQQQWADFVSAGSDEECATTICTIDKDLDMIPGWHYNWRKNELYWQDMAPALLFFYTQLLTGDRVDNIQGVPGIGPKKAEKVLEDCTTEIELESAVWCEYYDAITAGKIEIPKMFGGTQSDYADKIMKENADLLWIRRERGEEWLPVEERSDG